MHDDGSGGKSPMTASLRLGFIGACFNIPSTFSSHVCACELEHLRRNFRVSTTVLASNYLSYITSDWSSDWQTLKGWPALNLGWHHRSIIASLNRAFSYIYAGLKRRRCDCSASQARSLLPTTITSEFCTVAFSEQTLHGPITRGRVFK